MECIMEHGKSASQKNPMGIRRNTVIGIKAPKHFRKLGYGYASDVPKDMATLFYFNVDIKTLNKKISALKGLITKAKKANDDEKAASYADDIIEIEKQIETVYSKTHQFLFSIGA